MSATSSGRLCTIIPCHLKVPYHYALSPFPGVDAYMLGCTAFATCFSTIIQTRFGTLSGKTTCGIWVPGKWHCAWNIATFATQAYFRGVFGTLNGLKITQPLVPEVLQLQLPRYRMPGGIPTENPNSQLSSTKLCFIRAGSASFSYHARAIAKKASRL